MTNKKFLVLLETSGNQDYVFTTNRLRENVGASELTYRAGTSYVLDAVGQLGGPALLDGAPQALRDRLCDAPAAGGIEVIIATSGKALLLFDDPGKAKALVGRVTARALRKAPGLDLCGVVSDGFDWERDSLDDCVRNLHRKFEATRGNRPHPSVRFPTLPVVQPCASSGLPAWGIAETADGMLPLSNTALAKRDAAEDWLIRLRRMLPKDTGLPNNPDRLERDFGKQTWVAVVHADGNGFGEVFLNFGTYACPGLTGADRNAVYVEKLRRASVALEEATEAAFKTALQVLRTPGKEGWQRLPIVPLILGGDDLTAVCIGEYALPFTREFLAAFEQETADPRRRGGILPELAKAAHDLDHFAACAGVAIVKHHFPFHHAYELAEELIRSAKTVKTKAGPGVSALDFHVLYDASATSLDAIRKRLERDDSRLYARPYVVSDADCVGTKGREWAMLHHIDELIGRVRIIEARDADTDRPVLPSGQLHALREALFSGQAAADAQLDLMRRRYEGSFGPGGLDFRDLLEDGHSLFREARSQTGELIQETRFLDALDCVGFLGSSQERGE